MPNRPSVQWKNIEPGVPQCFRLIFSRNERDDGERDDGTKWYRYAVLSIADEIEYTLFTPTDECHEALQKLGIRTKGDEFSITKTTEWNKKTGKTYFGYEVEKGIVTEPPPEARAKPEPPDDPLEDTPYIEEPNRDHIIQFKKNYDALMTIKVDCISTFVKWNELDSIEKLNILCSLDKSTSANCSTFSIQNGGK